MFENNSDPTLYSQSYGRDFQVRNHSNSYTLPDFQLPLIETKVNKSKINTCFAVNIHEQDVNISIDRQNQTTVHQNSFHCMKACPYGNVQCKSQRRVKSIQLLNVNAPAFFPGNVKYPLKGGCNIFANVFYPKYGANTIKMNSPGGGKMANRFIERCSIDISGKLCNQSEQVVNGVEFIDNYNMNTESHKKTMLHESLPVLDQHMIPNHTGSTSVMENNIMFKDTSSTSRPCDMVNNYQQDNIIDGEG